MYLVVERSDGSSHPFLLRREATGQIICGLCYTELDGDPEAHLDQEHPDRVAFRMVGVTRSDEPSSEE